ncbi:MAG: YIP1 family protein [Bacteroidales bacterium]|jgi:hypothetical protein|nr:YIP1 family protein [Bacteroidales bacterium]
MNTFFLALFRPVKAFNEVKLADKFSAMSLIILLFLMLSNLILLIPATVKINTITFSSISLPEDQLDTITRVAYKMRYLQAAGTTILYLIMSLFCALLLYVFVRIAKEMLTYKSALQLFMYSYFIVTIGDLVNTALLYIRGLDAIKSVYDTSLTGLNLLTSMERVGITEYVFLSYITPFQVWFVVLLCIGLKIFTNMNTVKSVVISVLFWFITILIPTLSVCFSELTMEKSGIM